MSEFERICSYAEMIKERVDFTPEIAIVLGSGLNDFAEGIEVVGRVDYKDLPGFPTCSAEGHVGRFVLGYIENKKVIIMQGRVHLYEGYQPSDVVLPLRVMHQLGAKTVLFSNAAGSMRKEMKPSEFMVFTDQIAFLLPSVLKGENIDELGYRFPDTTDMFTKEIRETILSVAKENDIVVHPGVYIQAIGPQYESPAEMRAFASWGADAVGMSTAIEAIAALHMGMRIGAISCLTNYESGLGITSEPLTHEEVQAIANKCAIDFEKLIKGTVKRI